MRIKQLHIKNFRNFDEEVTIVPKIVNGMDMVVLVGENNAGKTSILTILHYLFNPERSIRTLEFQETDFYDIDEPITVQIIFSDLSDELRAHFIGMVDIEEVEGKEEWFLSLEFNCVYDKDAKEGEPSLVYGRQVERPVSFAEKRLISFYYQDALRDHRAIKSNKGSLFGRILQQIDLSAEETVILEKLDEAGDTLKDNVDISAFVNGVSEVTRRIIEMPDINDLLRLTVAASSSVDIKKNIQLQLKHAGSDRYLNIDQLGLGLQSVLTVSVFRAFAGIGKLREGIFAIDEPESHLYPHSQRSMYREIMELSKMRQVWVATHSPSLLEWINPRQICLVRKKADGSATTIQLPNEFPEEYIASYEKHLDVGKADAFFAKAVLLVEGPTEQGLFPALGLEYTIFSELYDLDRTGISVINAGGKNNIKALIQLLKNFDIPSAAMIDYDSKDKKHEEELDQIKEITDNLYELPRHIDMGDIEGFICLRAPIEGLVTFLEQSLSRERIDELFASLKGAVNSFNVDKAEQVKALRKQGAELSSCVPILNSVPEAEERVRKALAGGFRKIKGRTTGRLIGEAFWLNFERDFYVNTLDRVIKLAGYELPWKEDGADDEKS